MSPNWTRIKCTSLVKEGSRASVRQQTKFNMRQRTRPGIIKKRSAKSGALKRNPMFVRFAGTGTSDIAGNAASAIMQSATY